MQRSCSEIFEYMYVTGVAFDGEPSGNVNDLVESSIEAELRMSYDSHYR
jgi:hypothetical protein